MCTVPAGFHVVLIFCVSYMAGDHKLVSQPAATLQRVPVVRVVGMPALIVLLTSGDITLGLRFPYSLS
jgi:hypothetical protein